MAARAILQRVADNDESDAVRDEARALLREPAPLHESEPATAPIPVMPEVPAPIPKLVEFVSGVSVSIRQTDPLPPPLDDRGDAAW